MMPLSIIDTGPPQACPRPFNLAHHVLARGEATPDKNALQIVSPRGAERWSYGRLIAAVRGCGAGLLARGFAPGDRVLLRIGHEVAFPIAFLGCVAAGLVPVPTSTQLTEGEVDRLAALLRPALVIAGTGVLRPSDPTLPVVTTDEIAEMEKLAPCDWAMGDPDRLAYMVFTSGSSGTPRAVMHAHRAVWAREMMRDGWTGLTESDRLMHAGAFNWTYTLGTGLMDPWAAGATALIPAAGVTPDQLPLLMKRFDATIFAAAPGVIRQMLRATVPALPRLRHGLSAGESLPRALRAEWRAVTGTDLHEALGLSECSTFVSSSPSRPAPEGAIGYAQPGRRLAVLGETGAPVPVGQPGILAVATDDPGLFLGYFEAKEETKAKFAGDWFLTGDTVAMAEDGAFHYLGRSDDMMNAGGYRVSPVEVEAAIAGFPGLQEVAAAEVAVRPSVTVIACFYTSDRDLDEAALAAHAASRLARYKQPRLFLRVEALPKNANNKVLRRVLRQDWESRHGSA